MPNFTPSSRLTSIEIPSGTYYSMRNFAITGTLDLTGLTGLGGSLNFNTDPINLTFDQKRNMKLIPDYRPRSERIKNYDSNKQS